MKSKFKLKILHGSITVVVSKDLSKTANKHNLKFSDNIESYDAFVFQAERNRLEYFICFEKKYIKQSVISHEIVHLINAIYIDHGIFQDEKNDEWTAYFSGWLTEKICKILKPYL